MGDDFISAYCNTSYTYALKANNISKSDIKQVIYNNPATIVYFEDGSKVVVKTMKGDEFNEEVGLAMAVMKKMFGSSTAFKKFARKWIIETK